RVTRAALGEGAGERGSDRRLGAEVEVDPAAVVAVEGLDDAREAEPGSRRDGFLLGGDDVRTGDGQAGRVEELDRHALVRRGVDADRRRPRGHRRADPLLVDALAELDERVAVE